MFVKIANGIIIKGAGAGNKFAKKVLGLSDSAAQALKHKMPNKASRIDRIRKGVKGAPPAKSAPKGSQAAGSTKKMDMDEINQLGDAAMKSKKDGAKGGYGKYLKPAGIAAAGIGAGVGAGYALKGDRKRR